jgi:hypothetical protein
MAQGGRIRRRFGGLNVPSRPTLSVIARSERDEAIQDLFLGSTSLDCFASLAMTRFNVLAKQWASELLKIVPALENRKGAGNAGRLARPQPCVQK